MGTPSSAPMPCLFCELSKNTENTVYETEKLYVVVDRYPFSDMHLLVIPKEHRAVLHEVDDAVLSEVVATAKRLALKLGMQSYNLLQNNVNGQIIKHFHLHLIEANSSGRLALNNNTTLTLSDAEYAQLAQKVKAQIQKTAE